MYPRVREPWYYGSLYHSWVGLSSCWNVLCTSCKSRFYSQSSLQVNRYARGMVVNWLRAYFRATSGFGAILLSLCQLCDEITAIYYTGVVLAVCLSCWKSLWISIITSVEDLMTGRLSLLYFTSSSAWRWAPDVSSSVNPIMRKYYSIFRFWTPLGFRGEGPNTDTAVFTNTWVALWIMEHTQINNLHTKFRYMGRTLYLCL